MTQNIMTQNVMTQNAMTQNAMTSDRFDYPLEESQHALPTLDSPAPQIHVDRVRKASRISNWLLAAIFITVGFKKYLFSHASIVTKLKSLSFSLMTSDATAAAIYTLGVAAILLEVLFFVSCIYWGRSLDRTSRNLSSILFASVLFSMIASGLGMPIPLLGLINTLMTLWMLIRFSRRTRKLVTAIDTL